ncbi:Putative PH domain-containing protein [[Torrubiella] hemipterigena]|uniref:Putative PH domain-containing protein n=1 Tax=[Torrubiella] hemipterigena TaxID=1531966 RepID=A0A0A1SUM5_9HYPO|nr:Putative PH domain-containing protein [[Torrubiella] hemipterigena]
MSRNGHMPVPSSASISQHITRAPPPMESRGPPQRSDDAQRSPSPPRLRRRMSMDEDFFYQNVMSQQCRPFHPPSYNDATNPSPSPNDGNLRRPSTASVDDPLPPYSNSLVMQAVFSKKHEIENTTKRAEDRRWHNTMVVLNGTALELYNVKKDWGWGRSRDGPSINPDNPPWIKKAKLEKTYSLLHADAGIAADYKKRRYVIRIRAETDQFLLACVELSTFVRWLQALFAAIDIAAPIDDRDFPRDMSIPRIQRVRFYRGMSPTRARSNSRGSRAEADNAGEGEPSARTASRRSSAASPHVDLMAAATEDGGEAAIEDPSDDEAADDDLHDSDSEGENPHGLGPRLVHRLSATSYHNVSINPHSGKWFPDHRWTEAHDMLYAKLCFNNLLFRSPRKSNYIISKGKQWFVDWTTGKMVRVLPPAYGEVDYFGPWQVIHTENMRI